MIQLSRSCVALLLIAVWLLLTACSRNEEGSADADVHQTALQRAVTTRKIRIGYVNEAPFSYQEENTGELTGVMPEVARVLLNRIGIMDIEGVSTESGALIPDLQAGRFDIIVTDLYISPDRCNQITFSNPAYGVGEAFAVRIGNPLALHSFGDIAVQPNVRLGVVSGAAEAHYASLLGVRRQQMLTFPNAPSALEGLNSGRIDAYAGSRPTIDSLVMKNAIGVESAVPFSEPIIDGHEVRGYGGFGFRKRDQDFVDAFNTQLKTFVGSPAHLKLMNRFGMKPQDAPGRVTTDQLCFPAGSAT